MTILKKICILLECSIILCCIGCGSKSISDSDCYYFDEDEDSDSWRRTYAHNLCEFCNDLLNDKSTFDADLSAAMDSLYISMVTSPDQKLKTYSWENGQGGTMIIRSNLYQTKINGKFYAGFVEDMVEHPLNIYTIETEKGPLYLIHYYMQIYSGCSAVGFDAFKINSNGKLDTINVFERQKEYYTDEESNYVSSIISYEDAIHPVPPSAYCAGGWYDDLFWGISGKDVYIPHYALIDERFTDRKMEDYYDCYTWENGKFHRNLNIQYNPALSKFIDEGKLVYEFPLGQSMIRIDQVDDGTYRYIAWKKNKIFSAMPDLMIRNGWYQEVEHQFHFENNGYEYVFNTKSNQLIISQNKLNHKSIVGKYTLEEDSLFSNVLKTL